MKTMRVLVLCVYLFTAACSPVKNQAAASSTALAHNQSTATQPFPAPLLPTSFSIDKQVAQLIEEYQYALDEELAHGDTILVKKTDGSRQKVLTGKSKKKLDNLWWETTYTIDNLKARPPAEQQKVIDMLNARQQEDFIYTDNKCLPSLFPNPFGPFPVRYAETTQLPSYSSSALLEMYSSFMLVYFVDIASGQIIVISPLGWEDPPYLISSRFEADALEQKARQFIACTATKVSLSALTPVLRGDPDFSTFQWEDHSRKQPDGKPRYIQVTFRSDGHLQSYTNTLPLP
jgi:hypothetical protein